MVDKHLMPIARLNKVSLHYGKTKALNEIDLVIPSGQMVCVIGPDGVGKSCLLSIISGAKIIQAGDVEVFGGDMADSHFRKKICAQIAYMPQGLGKNLYPRLSVYENLDFFARLFGHGRQERERRIDELLTVTGLAPFFDRPAGQLSGGMKQKLGLCCALIHDPDFLILDEPTTGVDPLSRRLFWELIEHLRSERAGLSILVATAYMEEASHFEWIVTMNEGRVLSTGTTKELLEKTVSQTMEEAYIHQLPLAQKASYRPISIMPHEKGTLSEVAIEAHNLTKRFGDFLAVDHVSFRIERGEIFGFLGSNGCGKTTTMKMLTGLLPASEGESWLLGHRVDPYDIDIRRRVGYMTQSFSLYNELTVRQNLVLHARLFGIIESKIPGLVEENARRFELNELMERLPETLPLGQRQRLSLAVAMIHSPEILILDEPTSGVDPLARDEFWQIMINLSRQDKVTIFVSTHFMNEAERCDRISLMDAGRVLVSGPPKELIKQCRVQTLEEAFIKYLKEVDAIQEGVLGSHSFKFYSDQSQPSQAKTADFFSLQRMMSYARRETLELFRDPIRLSLSLLGSLFMMLALGYGINLDVENLTFAVLDRDQTIVSQDYELNLSGSRYFSHRPPIANYDQLDQRMRASEISLAIEIPPDFSRDLRREKPVSIGAWIDGSMPRRAETILGYVQGMHEHWLGTQARETLGEKPETAMVETRFLYNPDVKSMVAMVPAVIPLLLLMIPAILSALAVVREKELGSIVNLYVTPVTKLEFLLGKQIPYVVLAMVSFFSLVGLAVFYFDVLVMGSFLTLTLAALLFVIIATSFGLVISSFTKSQIAALFAAALLTMMPAIQYSGMIDPVSSLEGVGAFIGKINPTTYFLTIARGTFSKGLGFQELKSWFIPLLITLPVLVFLGVVLLRKQER